MAEDSAVQLRTGIGKAMRRKRSCVWQFFTPTDNRNKARCDACRKVYSMAGGSTSNLKLHIRSKHPELEGGLQANRRRTYILAGSTANATSSLAVTGQARTVNTVKRGAFGTPSLFRFTPTGTFKLSGVIIIRHVNGVKLADMLFSLCVSMCLYRYVHMCL